MTRQNRKPRSKWVLERRALILANLKAEAEIARLDEETKMIIRRYRLDVFKAIVGVGAIIGSLTTLIEALF